MLPCGSDAAREAAKGGSATATARSVASRLPTVGAIQSVVAPIEEEGSEGGGGGGVGKSPPNADGEAEVEKKGAGGEPPARKLPGPPWASARSGLRFSAPASSRRRHPQMLIWTTW